MKQYPSINDKAMTIHLDNRQKVDLSATGGGRPTLRPLGHRPGRQHSSMEWFAALSHLSMFSNCFFNNNHNIIIIIVRMMMMMMIKPLPPVLRCVSKNIPLHFDNNLNKACSSYCQNVVECFLRHSVNKDCSSTIFLVGLFLLFRLQVIKR